ncbi:MAG: hypothetical protein GY683_05635, partial [Moraxella sp.]|nr:hypothetical protein [Moraxella sp.]
MDQSVWLLLAVLAIVLGCILLVPAILRTINSKKQIDHDGDVHHKDGLPITPRDERLLTHDDAVTVPSDDAPDALTSMAAVAASSPVVSASDRPAINPAP